MPKSTRNLFSFNLNSKLHGLGLNRGALFTILNRKMQEFPSIKVRTGIEIVNVSKDESLPVAEDAHGNKYGPFDLMVVADGARSSIRFDTSH